MPILYSICPEYKGLLLLLLDLAFPLPLPFPLFPALIFLLFYYFSYLNIVQAGPNLTM